MGKVTLKKRKKIWKVTLKNTYKMASEVRAELKINARNSTPSIGCIGYLSWTAYD